MSLYVSKPSTIEAVQWGGRIDDMGPVLAFGGDKVKFDDNPPALTLLAGKDGAQEWVPVPVGHWLVCQPGDKSDIWPVDPDYFTGKYEPADA